MKVSELIVDIVAAAERKFAIQIPGSPGYHINDTITVWTYPIASGGWQVGLERPTKRQLQLGKFTLNTCKRWEMQCAFDTEAPTLIEALRQLYDQVIRADGTELSHD